MADARVLLAAGTSDMAALDAWAAAHAVDPLLCADAYVLAAQHQQRAMAEKLAHMLYVAKATPANFMQWLDALVLQGRRHDALAQLLPKTKTDHQARAVYLNIVADELRLSQHTPRYAPAVYARMAAMSQESGLSRDEQLNLAYALGRLGLQAEAESLLVALSDSKPFASYEVGDLLALWGKALPSRAITWIQQRARDAHDKERSLWLQHLNSTGHPDAVVAAMKGVDMHGSVRDEYVYALSATHRKEQLEAYLLASMAKENTVSTLLPLANLAVQEDAPKAAQAGWRKIAALDPNHAMAARELGLIAYSASHYQEAQRYLDIYLKQPNANDYQVSEAYAEMVQRKQGRSAAQPYYANAHEQLTHTEKRDIGLQMSEARLLYRNNRVSEALELYRALVVSHPKNKELRAQFGYILIEIKQFEEADRVLTM